VNAGMRKDLPRLRYVRFELPVFQSKMLYTVGKIGRRRAAFMTIGAWWRRVSQDPAALPEFRARRRTMLMSGFSNHRRVSRSSVDSGSAAVRQASLILLRIESEPLSIFAIAWRFSR